MTKDNNHRVYSAGSNLVSTVLRDADSVDRLCWRAGALWRDPARA